MKRLFFLLLFPVLSFAADKPWPGLPPDCWKEPRLTHSDGSADFDPWRKNTKISFIKEQIPKAGTFSPNKGYFFIEENGRPKGKVIVYAEKDHLIQIEFSDLFGLSDVRWINEKLLFMRPWWGRIVGTDIIYDVEKETIVYAETVNDGYIAHQQFLENCPINGCDCIKKQ